MSTLAVFAAFLRRDFRVNISYRASFAFQAFSMLFVLAVFFYLGELVDSSQFVANQKLSGGYFGYAAVGLALISIAQIGLASFSSKLREEQTTGTFEALMSTPTSPPLIVLASAAYDLLQATLSALVMITAAVVVFGLQLDLDLPSIGAAVVALVGCLGLFASLGVGVAALTVIVKRSAGILAVVVTAIGFLGGVYFPIELLPDPIEQVAEALPLTWGLDVLRGALLGGDVELSQLVGLFASAAVLLPLAAIGFAAAVRRARQTGTLAQY